MATRPLLLRARTVVPDPASRIDDGAVLIQGDRVGRVGRFADLAREGARVLDLGDVALLPGLVNAHCHLDLTGARGRYAPTPDFLAWILQMRPLRDELAATVAASVEEGARELLASGCTLVGDIVGDFAGVEGLRRSGIRAVAFHEVIGFADVTPKPLGAAVEAARDLPEDGTVTPGLAPHTPYTCTEDLLRRTVAAARERRLPVTLHAAETGHEQDWLLEGSGILAEILRKHQPEGWRPPAKRTAAYLRDIGFLDEPRLLAHGNYLDPAEMEAVRDTGSVVVHCPGSHAFFGHDRHPVAELRAAGVTVAVGTDGLVSHPDHALSVPGELRRLAAREPSLAPRDLLAMATTAGAEGLGLAGLAGVLAPGSFADAAAFSVPGGWKGPESLLDPDLRCTAAFVGGASRLDPKGTRPRA
jgi:cytosine/adenosine deaminase-related metal-dependent hydrolase